MTLEESLYAFLVGNAAVSALVAGQVYPVVIPESAAKSPPVITYRRAARSAENGLEGEAFITVTMEITTWDDDYNSVKATANTVAEQLLVASGLVMGTAPVETIVFETEEDDFIPEPLLYGVRQTFRFSIDP